MKLSLVDASFVTGRYTALESRWSAWCSQAADYKSLYLGDIWESAPEPDERRISAPICFDQVESARALLLAKPPIISVPASKVKLVEVDRAEAIEKYLYGVWAQAHVRNALDGAEWFANCYGAGVLRCLRDKDAADVDFPLLIQALDPTAVFTNPTGRPGQDSEVIHAYERPRREIEAEWGIKLSKNRGGANHEDWLDESVLFIDYWRADIEEVEVVEEKEAQSQKPKGALELLHEKVTGVLRKEKPEEPKEKAKKRVRKRIVTHCVVADGEVIKKAVKMPGYERLPFIRYGGISTPLDDENGDISVLFPITGGSRKNGATGLAAAANELIAWKQQIIEIYANAAIITEDPNMTVDFTPGAVNVIAKGAKHSFLTPPGPSPAVDTQIRLIQSMIEDSTINIARPGSEPLSGLALNVMNNPAVMKIAHRQRSREEAYQALNALILSLTEEYAPIEGWSVWGNTDQGEAFETSLKPAEINGYRRNIVKLSASLPRDESGEILVLSKLVNDGLISRETAMDVIQQIKSLPCQSPQDEFQRVLVEKMLLEGDTAKALAKEMLQEFSPELAESLQPEPPPGPPPGPMDPPPGMPPGPMGPPPGEMGPPPGPMQGVPPSAVPPQAMPEMLSPEARENMARQTGMF